MSNKEGKNIDTQAYTKEMHKAMVVDQIKLYEPKLKSATLFLT